MNKHEKKSLRLRAIQTKQRNEMNGKKNSRICQLFVGSNTFIDELLPTYAVTEVFFLLFLIINE